MHFKLVNLGMRSAETFSQVVQGIAKGKWGGERQNIIIDTGTEIA